MDNNTENTKKTLKKKKRQALTSEARELELEALANDLAEKKLKEGTASSQLILHYLKQRSERKKNEQDFEMKQEQIELMKAKRGAIEKSQGIEELFKDAMAAFKRYSGNKDDEDLF